MTKLFFAAAVAALAVAAPAGAQTQVVKYTPSEGLVPITSFDGSYQRADGSTGSQQGYIALYDDGFELCNGNQATTDLEGNTLQGYIWIGPDHRPANEHFGTGDGTAGAGNGDSNDDDVYEDGETPCPDGAR